MIESPALERSFDQPRREQPVDSVSTPTRPDIGAGRAQDVSPAGRASRPDVSPAGRASRPEVGRERPPPETWVRCFDDLPREHGFEPLRVEGGIPFELRGRVYRNGPGLQRAFVEPCGHWLDGDGVASAVWLEGGKAAGAARAVETAGLAAERRAGRRLFSGIATPTGAPVRELLGRRKNRANRSMFAWGGRILALGAGTPVELSPDDLSVRGELEPEVMGTARVHPRMCRVASRPATFGFSAAPWGKRIELLRFSDDGEMESLGKVALPRRGEMLEVTMSARHFVFCMPPLRAFGWRASLGLAPRPDELQWDAASGTTLVVVPIDDPERARVFTVEAFHALAFANAFERGSELVLDVCASDDLEGVDAWHRALPSGGARGVRLSSSLRRIVIDLRAGRARAERLFDGPCCLPRVSPLVQGDAHRYAFLVAHSSPRAAEGLPDRLVKLDLESGRAWELDPGPNQFPSEPVFVPQSPSGPGEPTEDDGWILTEIYDAASHRSHAAIIDAKTFAEPVARAHFDHHLPYSFHGTWVRSEESC